jgi:hypothetical protein
MVSFIQLAVAARHYIWLERQQEASNSSKRSNSFFAHVHAQISATGFGSRRI